MFLELQEAYEQALQLCRRYTNETDSVKAEA